MRKKRIKFFKEFKEFISKGNVLDMAVGVVIGGAFSKIISSLVADVITPLISLVMGKGAFSSLVFTLRDAELNEAGEIVHEAITINIGNFINNVIDFIIIAFCIFIALRYVMKAKRVFAAAGSKLKEIVDADNEAPVEEVKAAEPVEPPPPTEEEKTREVLNDIRAILEEIKEQK